jgi:membrane fusion protein, multidrug efflux system
MSTTRRTIATVLAAPCAAMVVCILTGCGGGEAAPATPVRPVRSMIVVASSNAQVNAYTAEIRSRYETDLSFQVGGKVVSRSVDPGAMVRKGTVLAQLDQTDQHVSVEAARAAISAAQAELERARSDEARYRDLLERGLTTRATHLAQQTAVKTSQSRLDQALAELKLNEQRLAYTTLRADRDGIITQVMLEAGSVVSAGQRVLSIAQPNELDAVFDVPDARIESIRSAAAAHMTLLDAADTKYPVYVREISPSADPITRTYKVKASIPNDAGLRLGMSVSIEFSESAAGPGMSVPATALFQNGHEPAVWIVKPDHRLELRPVRVERFESDRVLIADGLTLGERVVTAGVHRLAVGEQVRLLERGAK